MSYLRLGLAVAFVIVFVGSNTIAKAQPAPTDLAALEQLAADLSARYAEEHEAAVAWARRQGLPLRIEQADGAIVELVLLRDGAPIYYITDNADAADTVSADELWPGGSALLNLSGTGVLLHIWDGGEVLGTHQELTGRVAQQDTPAGTSDHSTHVAGTMIAAGVNPAAHGMADMATLDAYDFQNDAAEMALAAFGGAIASNHSYGRIAGWFLGDIGFGFGWHWFGDVAIDTAEDPFFGRYSTFAEDWDLIAVNAPFYLIVKSAGNDRNNAAPTAGTVHIHLSGGTFVLSNDSHSDDGAPDGYDTVPSKGNAKNILTIAAVDDIPGGYATPAGVVMSAFSGWGPTDDGRIKPDLSANGVGLLSSTGTGNSDYVSFSGTSMAAPNVTGSLGLLIEHYRATHSAADMRSATAKALLIHTADEAGPNDGPDFSFGWGLLDAQAAAVHISLDQISPSVIQELTISQGGNFQLTYPYFGTDPFKVTIAWTDRPGSPPPLSVDDPTAMLVNDLDLRVIEQGGAQHLPWRFDTTDPSYPDIAAERGDNSTDNVEVVTVDNPTPGLYTIQVSHKGSLQGGPQQFSLITDMAIEQGAGADFVFELDVTGSTGGLLGNWQSQMPGIIDQIETAYPGSYYGLASHLDYPFPPYGIAGEYAYRLESPLVSYANRATLLNALASLTNGFGNDSPESQCEAIVQALTGMGRDLNNDNDYADTGEIPPQAMGYRPSVPTVFLHFTWPPLFHNYPSEEANYPDPANPSYHAADWTDTVAAVTGHVNPVVYFGLVIGPLAFGGIDVQTGTEYATPLSGTDPITALAELTGGAVLDVGGDLSGLPEAIGQAIAVVDSSLNGVFADGFESGDTSAWTP